MPLGEIALESLLDLLLSLGVAVLLEGLLPLGVAALLDTLLPLSVAANADLLGVAGLAGAALEGFLVAAFLTGSVLLDLERAARVGEGFAGSVSFLTLK